MFGQLAGIFIQGEAATQNALMQDPMHLIYNFRYNDFISS